ncbi:hypothetical protein [Amphritea balenae]|uniref:hypothetical protein n=1 Tax=Amphritea balenae TaxID=452629 RepID=UPI001475A075|nr:hypothetical protein [Amphritea balenae]GGK54361.1 hypothetical protein GCM10007941_00530 [Amphritea balenae]
MLLLRLQDCNDIQDSLEIKSLNERAKLSGLMPQLLLKLATSADLNWLEEN